jgi:Polyketide cyclase / dehydrase and lipid transport
MVINILLIFAGIVALALIVLVIVIAMRPDDFRVARTVSMAAPASKVFPHVNDFHLWQAWSPYDKRDPAMQRTYDGAIAGTGAIYAWNGNNDVGEGRSTITESRANELIRIKLEFMRPFAGTNTAEFTFVPQGSGTAVTWALIGKYNFMTKAMGLVMSMDKMIGGDFEQGLASLKAIVEAKG